MKKIQLITVALLISGYTFAQNLPVDFESGGNGADWTWTTFENDDDPTLEIITNPFQTGINTSTTVAKFTARAAGQPYAGCETQHGSDIGAFTLSAASSVIKIMVYKSVISDVGIKLVRPGNGALPEIKVANTKINEWEELSFNFKDQVGTPAFTYDQIVVFMDFNARAAETVSYFDNISLTGFTPLAEPMTAAPDPTLPAADVISLFSGVYTDVPITTWRTEWSQGVLTDVEIDGNPTKKYSSVDFVGIEATGENSIDIAEMNYLNFHIWTPNSSSFNLKLVDFGADNAFEGGDDTEHEIIIENPLQEQWVSVNLALSDFTDLTTRANISQLILSSTPVGESTLYVDNVFFSKTKVANVETINRKTLSVYPNPSHGQVTLPASTLRYSITTATGQEVLSGYGNIANLEELSTGMYTIRAVLHDGTAHFGKISKI
ncbi:MAG: T9SS type A sorting domain-containing protein [Bacteroidia bacterium]|jgi:hypothetical protein|nr:T9SS type A sorting domain-containing protein [Bacteroidia bacterium]